MTDGLSEVVFVLLGGKLRLELLFDVSAVDVGIVEKSDIVLIFAVLTIRTLLGS